MLVKWRCPHCNDELVSDKREHHKMDWCKCEKSAVDAEIEYIRIVGDAEIISEE